MQYQLLDFGDGRKLERFGCHVLDRPAVAAGGVRKTSDLWSQADARFVRDADRGSGSWNWIGAPTSKWTISHEQLVFELRPVSSGQVGVFPEQAANWGTIAAQVRRAGSAPRVLNLFAYTGGSSLAAAAAGAEVVHVDGAKSAVQWARRNAELSGLAGARIRWIVEDARKFVARELRRNSQYQAVILDPPSYGHGPQREAWKIDEHLADLLRGCARLTKRDRIFVLLTCHSPGLGARQLEQLVRNTFDFGRAGRVTAGTMELAAVDGRKLAAGEMACWES